MKYYFIEQKKKLTKLLQTVHSITLASRYYNYTNINYTLFNAQALALKSILKLTNLKFEYQFYLLYSNCSFSFITN